MRQGYNRAAKRELTTDEQAQLQERALQGAAAGQLADFAEQVLVVDHERAIRARIFEMIDSSEPLDPQKAAQAWIELRAIHKLVSRLRKAASAGEAAGRLVFGDLPKTQ